MMKESLIVSWISSLTSVLDDFNKIDLTQVVETPIYSSHLKDLAKLLNRTYEEADQILFLKEGQLRDELFRCFEAHELALDLKRECSFCYGIYSETTKIGRVFLNNGKYEIFPLQLKESYSQIPLKEEEGVFLITDQETESKQLMLSLELADLGFDQVEKDYTDQLTRLNEKMTDLNQKRLEVNQMQWKNQWHHFSKESFKVMTQKEDVLKGYDACLENLKIEIRAYQALLHRVSGLKQQTGGNSLVTELNTKRQLNELFQSVLHFQPR